MTRSVVIVGCVLFCLVGLAPANNAKYVKLKDGTRYRFYSTSHGLWVSNGMSAAPLTMLGLPEDAVAYKRVAVSKDQRHVTIVTLGVFSHDSGTSTRISVAAIEARLENASALRLHKRGNFDGAAAGFSRALALDPSFRLAATNLASAHALRGDLPAAEAALAPLLKRDPLPTYVKVWTDPELAALRTRLAITSVETTTPGSAVLTAKGWQTGVAAYSQQYDLYAVLRPVMHGDGSCSSGFVIDFVSSRGKLVHHMKAIKGHEAYVDSVTCESPRRARPAYRKAVAKRLKTINRVLSKLGFLSLQGSMGHRSQTGRGVYLPQEKLGVAGSRGAVRVFRKGKIIATTPAQLQYVSKAAFLPSRSMVVAWCHFDPAHNYERMFVVLIPIT